MGEVAAVLSCLVNKDRATSLRNGQGLHCVLQLAEIPFLHLCYSQEPKDFLQPFLVQLRDAFGSYVLPL